MKTKTRADAETSGAQRDQLTQSLHANPRRQAGRSSNAPTPVAPIRMPSPLAPPRAGSGREDWHQHGVGHPDKTDQAKQQQDGADRAVLRA